MLRLSQAIQNQDGGPQSIEQLLLLRELILLVPLDAFLSCVNELA